MRHRLAGAFLCFAAISTVISPGLAEVPQTSHPGAVDGDPARFAGEWSAFRPGGEDETLIICSAPLILSDLGDGRLSYRLLYGRRADYTVTAADGRTLWSDPLDGDQVAVWIDADEFHLHPVSPSGKPDWAAPLVHHRCPVLARESHAGAQDGMAAPFAGEWAISVPSPTGDPPDQTLLGCENPIRLSVAADAVVRLDDTPPTDVPLTVHDGHTDWIVPDAPAPWEVVWVDADRFHVFMIGLDSTTDWRSPLIYRRCPG